MRTRKILSAVAFLMAAVGAQAADALYKGPVPAALSGATKAGQLEIVKPFEAASSLTGWVVRDTSSSKNIIVYTTKDGDTMIAGLLMDKTGKNLTAEYNEKYIPGPDYKAALDDITANGSAATLGNPKAPAEITVFFDANCGYCKVMHRLVTPAIAAGELKVHYVPVAILGADSDRKGAGLLASKNQTAAVDALAQGGVAEASSDSVLLAKVRKNTELMKKHGFNGTPGVLYMGRKGAQNTVFVANGVPTITDMFSKLGISGQVDQLKNDPQLARFLR